MKKVLNVLLAVLIMASFAACSDDDSTTPIPAGYQAVKFVLNTAADSIEGTGLLPSLMGLSGPADQLRVYQGNLAILPSWSELNPTNQMVRTGADTYELTVYVKAADGDTSPTMAIEFKYALGTSGIGAKWYNAMPNADIGAINGSGTGYVLTNTGGGLPNIKVTVTNMAGTTTTVPLTVSNWAAKYSTDPTATVDTATTLTINWSGVPTYWGDGSTTIASACQIAGSAGAVFSSTSSDWNPGSGYSATVPGDGTATITLNVPAGTLKIQECKLTDGTWDAGQNEVNNHVIDVSVGTIDLVFDYNW